MRAIVRKFNVGLFAPGPHGVAEPLPVDTDMLELLIQAVGGNWADVEPAILGTLLENALDGRQRSELGAHFTPRAFVERLVLPTVMQPLRLDWDGAKAAAEYEQEKYGGRAATAIVRTFHARLCAVRVLDPACGSGNFLYVTMEMMKAHTGPEPPQAIRVEAMNPVPKGLPGHPTRNGRVLAGMTAWQRGDCQRPPRDRRIPHPGRRSAQVRRRKPSPRARDWPSHPGAPVRVVTSHTESTSN